MITYLTRLLTKKCRRRINSTFESALNEMKENQKESEQSNEQLFSSSSKNQELVVRIEKLEDIRHQLLKIGKRKWVKQEAALKNRKIIARNILKNQRTRQEIA